MHKKLLVSALALLLCVGIFLSVALPAQAAAGSVETLINTAELSPVRTGYARLDQAVDAVFKQLFKDGMTAYDKIKAVYDYMIKNYSGNSVSFNVRSDPQKPSYSSATDRSIVDHALTIIESHSGTCLHYSSAFVVFARALGFEAYRMYGKTAMAAGGMGEHYWPEVVIDGARYVFDPQVDDHIAGGGAIKYWRFCQTQQEMSGLFWYARPADVQMKEHNRFDMPVPKGVQITDIVPGVRQLAVNSETTLMLKAGNPDNIDVYYSFFFTKGLLEDAQWLPEWKTIALNSKSAVTSWTPAEEGYYTIKATVKSQDSLSLLDTKTIVVFAGKSAGFTLFAGVLNPTVNSSFTLGVNVPEGAGDSLRYDFTYIRNGGTNVETLVANSPLSQISFTPSLAGSYLFTAYVNDGGARIASSSLAVDVGERIKKGDLDTDGKITANDARIAIRASASILALTAQQKAAADVDADGRVTAADSRTILRVSAGLQSF
ncbi:MAG: dockerin type I domain-containing protein [Oscillospiraceae bacterium]|jgi:hypothetical protein|nr:dockerin type I domain-containing protein [Oscillospiraceae bacterium]